MGKIIAMAGKGGTGKTTIAALIVRLIKEKKLGSVLAIDADPNSNLGETLGVKVGENIGEILDRICANPDEVPASMPKDRYIEMKVQESVQEEEGFDILTMGKPEGPGCYCYVNNILRAVMTRLIKDYDFIVIDNEAGLEHLSRRTTRFADSLIVVSDASSVGLKSAGRIVELVKKMKFEVKKSMLLVNRSDKQLDNKKIAEIGLDYLGNLPRDLKIEELSQEGKSVFELENDSHFYKSISLLGERIWN